METPAQANDVKAAVAVGQSISKKGPRLSKGIWRPMAWLAAAVTFWTLIWFLDVLYASDIYVQFTPGINSHTIKMALTLLFFVAVVAAVRGFTRLVRKRLERRWLRRLVKVIVGITLTCFTVVTFLSMMLKVVSSPQAAYVMQAPNDDRSVLILNKSFLLLGSFRIYEPRQWPIYSEAGWITTDDGYDPFREGKYTENWTEEGLELDFVDDYMHPERFERHFVQLPKSDVVN